MRSSVLLVVALLAAGCLSDSADDEADGEDDTQTEPFAFVPPETDFDFSTVVDPDHGGHSVAALHTVGHGLNLVGHTGVQDILPTTTRGSITAVDIWGDYAVVSGMEGGLAFVMLDISDPANPEAIGWAPSAADGWTARFSGDGNTVFYGCQMVSSGYAPSNVVGTCEDPMEPHLPTENPMGVSAWDVTDKSNPTFLDFIAVGGAHNIFAQEIDGVDYIFTSQTAILRFDNETKTLEHINDVQGRHDQTVVKHPITGDWLLLVGTGELSIWNVNDPAEPEQIYEGTGQEGWTGWHDQVLVPGLVDGRVILLLAGETGVDTGGEVLGDAVDVVDLTDPSQPVLLSSWQPPFRPLMPWAEYAFSIHEMAATPTGQVAVAWYHAGVWVIDVSTQLRQGGPITLAAYQPHEDLNVVPSTFAQTPVPYVPMVWSAAWTDDGYLVVPDMHSGVYVLQPDWGLIPGVDGGQ